MHTSTRNITSIFSTLSIFCLFIAGCITNQPNAEVADLLANQRMADCKEDEHQVNFCIRNATSFDLEDLVINAHQTAIYFGSLKKGEITCMVHIEKALTNPFVKLSLGRKDFYILPGDSSKAPLLSSGRYIYELRSDSIKKQFSVQLIEASDEETGLVPYRTIDSTVVARLNATIQSKKITDLNQLAQLYHPKEKNPEGNYYYQTSSRIVGPNTTELIITETGLMDDAVKGIKTLLLVNTANKVVEVISMKESFLCYRSKQGWTSELCK